jgi:hypothetical protein
MIELIAAMMVGCGGGPAPDPNPGTTRPVTCTDWTYDYQLPAINEATGQEISAMYFACHHPKGGRDTCVLVSPRLVPSGRVNRVRVSAGLEAVAEPSSPAPARLGLAVTTRFAG